VVVVSAFAMLMALPDLRLADSTVQKPFTAEELLAQVNRTARRLRPRPAIASQNEEVEVHRDAGRAQQEKEELVTVSPIGTALAGLVAPRVAAGPGWPAASWLWLPLLVLMAVVFWLVARDAPGFEPVTTPVGRRFGVFRREPLTWVLALFYFVTFGGFVAIANYLPTLLVSTYRLEPADAAARVRLRPGYPGAPTRRRSPIGSAARAS
jgi:hypothetical protein